VIEQGFTEAERERFQNLLKLAADSTFEGERANAIAAAERLAAKHGMTLEEAAAWRGEPPPRDMAAEAAERAAARAFAQFVHMTEQQRSAEKYRWETAMRAARARGLDAEEEERSRRRAAWRPKSTSRRRMEPWQHARLLLTETSLPLREIAEITGLDLYDVVGLKLKLRAAA